MREFLRWKTEWRHLNQSDETFTKRDINKAYKTFILVISVDCKTTKWQPSAIEIFLDFCLLAIINETGCKCGKPYVKHLTFVCPCIANIFAAYNQQDAKFHNLFISVKCFTCFRRFSVHHQEIKTAHTASGICQTNTATCCQPGQASGRQQKSRM